jgi:1-acyl-sn-glycerol-3-phosphate acyltransferase
LLAHCVYRIRKEDLDKIPETGPALLVCNHVSFFDPPILLGVLPRPARFVMWYGFYELPIAGRLFRWLKSIPIGNRRERPELVKVAFDTIAEELQAGRLVVVFPEGAITRDGEVSKFQPGIDEILKRTPVPVIPLALRGVWGTWSSRKRGSALKGWPTGFMKKLTVVAGDPVAPEDATRLSMHDKVKALRGDEK